jgi:GNAT superfamily N-acetyltransferase
MSAVVLRAARPEDEIAIRGLERTIVEATLPLVRELSFGIANTESAGAGAADALRLVAVTPGEADHLAECVVGVIALTERVENASLGPHAHIRALAVAAPHRRQGVGTRLLSVAEAWARRRGLLRIGANVAEDNRPALAFFHHAGYHGERGFLDKRL